MQTFLPYADFRRSAACLDTRRLGKQRIEARQILRVLRGLSKGWAHHPAVLMWRGHEAALGAYMNAVIDEWVLRGYRNSIPKARVSRYRPPSWLGDRKLHASHRSNLLRKDPEHYSRFGWREAPGLAYAWPVPEPPTPRAQRRLASKPRRIARRSRARPSAWPARGARGSLGPRGRSGPARAVAAAARPHRGIQRPPGGAGAVRARSDERRR